MKSSTRPNTPSALSRRSVLMAALAAPLAFFGGVLWANPKKKTVKTTAEAAKKALVGSGHTMANALQYVAKAKDSKRRQDKTAICANCVHYAHALDAAGKDIKVNGQAVGSCVLFDGGKSLVTADGWCMSWMKAA